MPAKFRFGMLCVVTGLATGALTSCSTGATEFEQAIINQAEQVTGSASLPGHGAPFDEWDQLVIMCPYMYEPEDLEPKFAKAVTDSQDFLDESSQWFIFAQNDQSKMMRLSRNHVDFCSEELAPEPLDADQLFSASQTEGRWVFTPVG